MQALRHPLGHAVSVVAQVSLTGRATDHQRPHEQEPRPDLSHDPRELPHRLACAVQNVLVDEEERLHRARRARVVLDHEVPVIEVLADRVFDDSVVAMVLAVAVERRAPGRRILDLGARGDPHRPV